MSAPFLIQPINPPSDWTPITQLSWFVDYVAGSDSNAGTTAAFPLKTFAELRKRLSYGAVDGNTGNVTVNVMSNSPEDVYLPIRGMNFGQLIVQGYTRTSLGAFAISAITPWNDGTSTELSFTCSSIPTSLTALGAVGYLAEITGGPRAGLSTFVIAETSSKVSLSAGWMDWNAFDIGTAQVGDTVTFYTLLRISGFFVIEPIGDCRIVFQDLEIADSTSFHGILVTGGQSSFYRCRLHSIDSDAGPFTTGASAGAIVAGCLTVNGCRAYNGGTMWTFSSAHTRNNASALNAKIRGEVIVDGQSIVYQNAFVVEEFGIVGIYGSLSVYDTPVGIYVSNFSGVSQTGYFWVRNCASVGFWVFRRAGWTYGSHLPAIVGTAPTSATRMGATTAASLVLPLVVGTASIESSTS